MELSEEVRDLIRRYEERFGEQVPFGMMLPPSEDVCVPILRQCLEEGSTEPIDRRFPPGVAI